MGDENGIFTYIDWQDRYNFEKPFFVFSDAATQDPGDTTNLVFTDGPSEKVRDARDPGIPFSLDTHGFQFCNHGNFSSDIESLKHSVSSTDQIEKAYCMDMEDLLRTHVPQGEHIVRVYFFDYRIRRNFAIASHTIDANDKMQHLLPARHVHIDQTPSAVLGRIKLHVPADEAEMLLRECRVRVINLWRPLCPVVEDRPLALCDRRSIKLSDLVEADHVRKHYSGSSFFARPSEQYQWWYLPKQTCDEVTLIQMFDSSADGSVVSGCLHSSFDLSRPKQDPVKRESIEVRALVFSTM